MATQIQSAKIVTEEIENAAGANPYSITLTAEQATTSGTSIDFTGIPAGVTVIKLMLTGVSNNGTSALMAQLGDSDGIETSAYVCNASNDSGESTQSTAGFLCGVSFNQATGTLTTGILTICLKDSANNEWVAFGGMGETQSSYNIETIGSKSLSGVLTQVRLTAINGSDVFDAGSAAIQFQ